MDTFERFEASNAYSKVMEHNKWIREIPYIPMKPHWKVMIAPPMTGAVVRFRVKLFPEQTESVSIYLDCYDTLGLYGEPYWEVYPFGGDTYRCAMNDVENLVMAIETSLKEITPKEEILKYKLDKINESKT